MSTLAMLLQSKIEKYTFTAFDRLTKIAGLEHELQGYKPMTVFVPPDQVFEQLYYFTHHEELLENTSMLKKWLAFYFVPLKLMTYTFRYLLSTSPTWSWQKEDLLLELPTLSGHYLHINYNQTFSIEQSKIIKADLEGENGVIHIIDSLLYPPDLTRELLMRQKMLHFPRSRHFYARPEQPI